MTALVVKLVGGLRVATGNGRELPLKSRKSQALFACLALAPGAKLQRDLLASLLWDQSDAELARSSLRQALAALRRWLPRTQAAALQADAGLVWLDATRVTSDVGQFRHALRTGDAEAACKVFETGDAGELLPGLDARSSSFDQWLDEQRRQLRRERLDALERLATQHAATPDAEGERAALERLLVLDPVNERAHRALMDAFARAGRHTEALRQYRVCRDTLRRELDVATEPATDALHREILRRRRASTTTDAGEDFSEASLERAALAESHDEDAASRSVAPSLREAVVLCVRRVSSVRPRAKHDPEQEHARESAWFDRVRSTVLRFGGEVGEPVHGESIAAFGLGAWTGNEADRATRAAFELAHGIGEPADASVDTTCGLAAGQVLPRAAPHAPLNGHAVALARELARLAPKGALYATEALARRLGDAVESHAVETTAVDDARRLEVTAARPAQRTFVGRRAELGLLVALLDRVADSRKGRAVVIRGEAGIGKSALIAALVRAAGARGVVTQVAQVLDFGQREVERPVAALLRGWLDDAPSSAPDDASLPALIEQSIQAGRLRPAERLIASGMLGARLETDGQQTPVALPGGNAAREQTRAALLQRLVQQAAATPRLIVVEDVHWATAAEMRELADLAAGIASHPVLLVLSVRSDDDPLDPAWRAHIRGCPLTTLDLAPLDEDEARELAASHGQWPANVLERCLDMAAGHPLHLEQLLRAASSGDATLPGSVRALVLARIERLPPAVQRALQAGAVLGHRFTIDALRYVLADPAFDVSVLDASGLVAADGDERQFAHALMRDAVHESLLGSTRRTLHRRAAAWFESRDAALWADHLAAADDALATVAYRKAATEALQAHRLERALDLAERARESAQQPLDHGEVRALLGDVWLAMGRTLDACAAFRESIDLALDGEARVRGWLGLATALRILDRYDEALAALDRVARELPADDHRRQARLWTMRGNLHFPLGEIDRCLDAHEQALAHAQRAGSIEDLARAAGGVGDAQYQRGRLRSAHAQFERCVELCEQHGLAGLRLAYVPMVAVTKAYLADLTGALGLCESALAASRSSGDRRAELLAGSVASSVHTMRAQYGPAVTLGLRGVELARALGTRRFEAENLGLLGLARLGLGEHELALATLERAASLAREACPSYCGPWAFVALAQALQHEERWARALLDEGEALLGRGCVSHNHLEFRHHAMVLLAAWQDWTGVARQADALEHYTRHEPLPWADLTIAAHRALYTFAMSPRERTRPVLVDALERVRAVQFLELAPPLERALATFD